MSAQDLRQFLKEVEELIDHSLEQRATLIPRDLQSPFVDAWPDAKESLRTMRRELLTIYNIDERLTRAGLTGPQLALKLIGFQRALAALHDNWERRPLWRTLGWANIILGSLASVLPGGEAIKEYKEALERAVGESEN